MQRGVDGPLGEGESVTAVISKPFDHAITVEWAPLDNRQQKQIQVTFQGFAFHT